MLEKKVYANGQKVYEQNGDRLTYFFKNGRLKAEGFFINELMEGEWKFYRENGQLWSVVNLKNGKKAAPGSGMTKTGNWNMMKSLWITKK